MCLLFISKFKYLLGNSEEHRLQSLLFKEHDPRSIPVRNASKTLMVNFDIALRSIQALVNYHIDMNSSDLSNDESKVSCYDQQI